MFGGLKRNEKDSLFLTRLSMDWSNAVINNFCIYFMWKRENCSRGPSLKLVAEQWPRVFFVWLIAQVEHIKLTLVHLLYLCSTMNTIFFVHDFLNFFCFYQNHNWFLLFILSFFLYFGSFYFWANYALTLFWSKLTLFSLSYQLGLFSTFSLSLNFDFKW